MKIINGWRLEELEIPLEEVLQQVGPGWRTLVIDLINDLEKLGWNGQLCQIKEKFGGLRFYINGGSEEVFQRISRAEYKSFKVCEVCGRKGKLRSDGWLKTLCKEHFVAWINQRQQRRQ